MNRVALPCFFAGCLAGWRLGAGWFGSLAGWMVVWLVGLAGWLAAFVVAVAVAVVAVVAAVCCLLFVGWCFSPLGK